MIAHFFKQSKPIVFILLGMVLSLVYFLDIGLRHNLSFSFGSLGVIVFKYALLLLAFIIFELSVKHFEIQKGHSYVSLFFVLLCIFLIPDIITNSEFYAFVILTIAVTRILNLAYAVKIKTSIFESVTLICVAGLFYKPVLVFLILVLIATLLFTNSHWRYFVIPLFAVSAVVILTQIFYLQLYNTPAGIKDLLPVWRTDIDVLKAPQFWSVGAFWVFSVFVVLFQIYSVKRIRSLYHRQMASFFLGFIFLALVSSVFQSSSLSGLWLMSLWPFCIYLGDFISRIKKNLWLQIGFWFFVLIPITIYIMRS